MKKYFKALLRFCLLAEKNIFILFLFSEGEQFLAVGDLRRHNRQAYRDGMNLKLLADG